MAVVDRDKLEARRAKQARLVAALPPLPQRDKDAGAEVRAPEFNLPADWTAGGADEVEALLRDLAESSLEKGDLAALVSRSADALRQRARDVVSAGTSAERAKDDALAVFDRLHPGRPRDVFDDSWTDALVKRVRVFMTLVAAADAVGARAAASRS